MEYNAIVCTFNRQRVRTMISRSNRVLTVAITWLVIVFGCYFFYVARPELRTNWVQLPPLPKPATAVELTRFGLVLATTENGTSYKRDPWDTDQPWVLYNESTEEFNGEPCAADDGSRFIPPPPGKVVTRSSRECFVSAETRILADVALLENGEVWMWTYAQDGLSEAVIFLLLIAAGALGVVILLIGLGMRIFSMI